MWRNGSGKCGSVHTRARARLLKKRPICSSRGGGSLPRRCANEASQAGPEATALFRDVPKGCGERPTGRNDDASFHDDA
ncbi:hypothetical protein MRX96_024327 [Rhipicephalus microplus]